MKSTDNFKQVIETYCKAQASNDAEFKAKFESKNKNINDCVKYILNTVKNSGCNGFADEEIFGMALHYYDEENIDVGKDISANVIVNNTGNNKYSKAHKINTEELKSVNEKLKEEPDEEMKKHWEQDLKNIRTNPKKYWNEFSLESFKNEKETHEKISFMQNHYKEQADTKPKPTIKKPQEKPKVKPKMEVVKTPVKINNVGQVSLF